MFALKVATRSEVPSHAIDGGRAEDGANGGTTGRVDGDPNISRHIFITMLLKLTLKSV